VFSSIDRTEPWNFYGTPKKITIKIKPRNCKGSMMGVVWVESEKLQCSLTKRRRENYCVEQNKGNVNTDLYFHIAIELNTASWPKIAIQED
jgi:hypothetical protein